MAPQGIIGLLGLHFAVLLGLAADQGASYLDGRHFFPMVLYALPFAGAGLASVRFWGTDRLGAPRLFPGVAVALLVAVTVLRLFTSRPGREAVVRPAAAWLRARVVGTPVVSTNVAKLTYHAGAERVMLAGTYEDVLRLGRARSAHFLAFYPDMLPGVSRDFPVRLDAADLELVKTFLVPSPWTPNRRLELYRLRPQ